MPKRYPPGRTCQAEGCANPLTPVQEKFCSVPCARTVTERMDTAEIDARMPSDDEVWENRAHMRYPHWARAAGLKRGTVQGRLARRGWHSHYGRYTHAPCSKCGNSFPITPETEERLCLDCLHPQTLEPTPRELLFQEELNRRLPGGDRHHLLRQVGRRYTALAGRKRAQVSDVHLGRVA